MSTHEQRRNYVLTHDETNAMWQRGVSTLDKFCRDNAVEIDCMMEVEVEAKLVYSHEALAHDIQRENREIRNAGRITSRTLVGPNGNICTRCGGAVMLCGCPGGI